MIKTRAYETDAIEGHGRRLMVEFTCVRCKTKAIRPLGTCLDELKDSPKRIYDMHPPEDWQDGGFYYPLFCPKCSAAYDDFMNMREV